MPRPQSEAPDLHFERARDRAGQLQNFLVRRLLVGGAPGPGVVVEEGHRSKISLPSRLKYAKMAKKTGSFAHVLANKLLKTPFFVHKYLTKYTHETFFRGIHEFSTSLLKPLQRYTSSKFWKSYMPPAARIRVKSLLLGISPLCVVRSSSTLVPGCS
jgi:hypothetical protein